MVEAGESAEAFAGETAVGDSIGEACFGLGYATVDAGDTGLAGGVLGDRLRSKGECASALLSACCGCKLLEAASG